MNFLRRLFGTIICLFIFNNAVASGFNVQHWHTSNGVHVIFRQSMDIPMLVVNIAFAAGSAHDHQHPGLSTLTMHLLDQGNAGLSAIQIADQLSRTGAQLSATNNQDMIALSLKTLTRNDVLPNAIQALSLIINQPDFTEEALVREKNKQLMMIRYTQDAPELIAKQTFFQALYANHPYGHSIYGDENSINAISRDDIKQFYQTYFVGKNATIVLVGAIDTSTAKRIVEQLTGSLSAGEAAETIPLAKPLQQEITVEVPHQGSQSQVYLGQLGITHHDPQFFPLMVGNYILGGNTMESELGVVLRVQRGLTYGVNSQFLPMPGIGPFIITFATKNQQANTGAEVARQTLANFIKQGPSEPELDKAKRYLTGSYPISMAGSQNEANILLKTAFYHLPEDFFTSYTQRINAVTTQEIHQAFQQQFNTKHLLQVIVGKPK